MREGVLMKVQSELSQRVRAVELAHEPKDPFQKSHLISQRKEGRKQWVARPAKFI